MNEYSVFWIKEEFAYHYFYKSDILYRFIKSYQHNKERQDLSTQYFYITNNFPRKSLISHTKRKLIRQTGIQISNNQLILHRDSKYISLHIYEHHLKFYCKTLDDAEELLFPTLRLFHPFLFIIGNNLEDYGWISPVKNGTKYKSRQVLYSYL